MSSWLLCFWYQQNNPLRYLLYPFHLLFHFFVYMRICFYQWGIFKSKKVNCPVIIIGNITVGGTGKSPLVIHLADVMTKAGFQVGIVSRGYGGQSETYPLEVMDDSLPDVVGDEPMMIKAQTQARLVVDPKRARGAEYLVEQCACNLIICDDGLQHYALQRDIEIVVVDGQRRFGNGLLMPFGPLREPGTRLKDMDGVVVNIPVNGKTNENPISLSLNIKHLFFMELESSYFVSLNDTEKKKDIKKFVTYCQESNKSIHSFAGIGNPQRFFDQLQSLGLNSTHHTFSDHHPYRTDDFTGLDAIIVMTEKDAVKCRQLKFINNGTNEVVKENIWYLKVTAKLTPSLDDYCIKLLDQQYPDQLKRED